MNERIKELVKEAKDHADYYAMLSDDVEQEIFTEKFAELIVRECAEYMNEFADNGDIRNGDDLLKHLGVEE
jgi:hypothetical protein